MGCNGTKNDWHGKRRWCTFQACISMGCDHFEDHRDPYFLVQFSRRRILRDVGVAGSNPVTPTSESIDVFVSFAPFGSQS